jgi:hypothetical protein
MILVWLIKPHFREAFCGRLFLRHHRLPQLPTARPHPRTLRSSPHFYMITRVVASRGILAKKSVRSTHSSFVWQSVEAAGPYLTIRHGLSLW